MPKIVKIYALYIIAVPILVISALMGGCECFGLFNHFPAPTLKAIANDTGLIVYSIDPSEGSPKTVPGTPGFTIGQFSDRQFSAVQRTEP